MDCDKIKVSALKGIGEKKEEILKEAGISSVLDLLNTFPKSYEIIPKAIDDLTKETNSNKILIRASFKGSSYPFRVRKNLNITKVRFMDDKVIFYALFFNKPYISNSFNKDEKYLLYGKVRFNQGQYQIIEPKFCVDNNSPRLKEGLYPIYKTIKGFSNNDFNKSIKQGVALFDNEDCLPLEIKKKHGLASIKESYELLHFPKREEDILKGGKRVDFDDFVGFSLNLIKAEDNRNKKGYLFKIKDEEQFTSVLPFKLTSSQEKAIKDINHDLTSQHQMMRLIQGDVGCGKTVLASYALYQCVKNGFQGVFCAPTQILAFQHFEKLSKDFESFGFNVVCLNSKMSAKERREVTNKIKSGEADIIIGTHAVFSKDVVYNKLGLIVIDEQHRFGVGQRASLEGKGESPHVLVMSATPIPRTLALACYKDLDLTIVKEKPKNRKEIITKVINNLKEEKAYQFALGEINKGRQAYVVCPSIEAEELASVNEVYEKVKGKYFSKVNVEILHGKMKEEEKNKIMQEFYQNKIQVLIATSVIEVGIDVGNASVIIIEDSHRFGLAALHQLRGRVGRGEVQSYCFLLSEAKGENSLRRLRALEESCDGFYLANEDLKQRGFGDFLGYRQSGFGDFNILKALENDVLFLKASEEAKALMKNNNAQNEKYINKCLKNYESQFKKISLN